MQPRQGGNVERPDGLERDPLLVDEGEQLARALHALGHLRAPAPRQRVVCERRQLGELRVGQVSVCTAHPCPY
jgi:hypothetical protein